MLLEEIIILFILFIILILAFKLILEYGGTILKIVMHLAFGWITLGLVNIIPGINVPINLITVAISGFGGVLGTFLLVLYSIIF
ncbi:pro-sigmaK processing inhibitor BofA family protein [Methanosphaera sp. BMS]|uniref:pro-sigmaK processing inhibitor BofA family protein n=1 Tax=Methanosphaera sp. BMS TaxID=1789762 RepID=UPI000DC1E0C7|nr:pro-sigmaK processing inhibitor BofA family protein [Methanosphaera sp. BMS]AWX33016.1 sigmaK-factor processing regulatory BofA [Methanosphaera sp. BMS]